MRAILIVAVFLLLAGCAMQSAQDSVPTFEHLMFKADERIQARNFEAGRKLLSEAAAMEPTRKEPWLRQAELEFEAEEPAPAPAAETPPADELLLDASRLVEEDQPVAGGLPGRRRGLVASESGEAVTTGEGDDPVAPQPAPKAPRVSSGGATLFERMANLSRGGRAKDEEDDDDDDADGPSISIPRFLGRQNNQ